MTTIYNVVSVFVVVPEDITMVVGVVNAEVVPAPLERFMMGPVEVDVRGKGVELPPEPTDTATTGDTVVEATVEAAVIVVEDGPPALILIAPRQPPRGDGALF